MADDEFEGPLFSADPESEEFPTQLERLLLIYAALVADTEREETLSQISDEFDRDFHQAETMLLDFEQTLIEEHAADAGLDALDFFPDEDPARAELKHRLGLKKIVALYSQDAEEQDDALSSEEMAAVLEAIDNEARQVLDAIKSDPQSGIEKADQLLALWEIQVIQKLYPDLFDNAD